MWFSPFHLETTGAATSNARPGPTTISPFKVEIGLSNWSDFLRVRVNPARLDAKPCGLELSICPGSSGKKLALRTCELPLTDSTKLVLFDSADTFQPDGRALGSCCLVCSNRARHALQLPICRRRQREVSLSRDTHLATHNVFHIRRDAGQRGGMFRRCAFERSHQQNLSLIAII